MSVEILTFVTGPFATNSYLLRGAGACWVIDPGFGPRELLEFLSREHQTPDRIVLTHGHCDHIAGISDVRASFGSVPIWSPAADADMLTDAARNLSRAFGLPMTFPPADALFQPGETLRLGESAWEVLDTSGHTPGGVSLYGSAENAVFTGDALFAQSIGRTDFPDADTATLLGNIRRALLSLPDETKVYPGHGPVTSIGAERRSNPFLREGPTWD